MPNGSRYYVSTTRFIHNTHGKLEITVELVPRRDSTNQWTPSPESLWLHIGIDPNTFATRINCDQTRTLTHRPVFTAPQREHVPNWFHSLPPVVNHNCPHTRQLGQYSGHIAPQCVQHTAPTNRNTQGDSAIRSTHTLTSCMYAGQSIPPNTFMTAVPAAIPRTEDQPQSTEPQAPSQSQSTGDRQFDPLIGGTRPTSVSDISQISSFTDSSED